MFDGRDSENVELHAFQTEENWSKKEKDKNKEKVTNKKKAHICNR